MADAHGPGQDLRAWRPGDLCDVPCPNSGNLVERWKDEPVPTCSKCHSPVPHPRWNRGGLQ
jgi:hypothetical protein